jgi:hypothetical protein
MVKRLQVLLDDDELEEIQRTARRKRITTAAWVRRALRESLDREPRPDVREKLAVIRRAVQHSFPSGDIEQMLEETERGYLDEGA